MTINIFKKISFLIMLSSILVSSTTVYAATFDMPDDQSSNGLIPLESLIQGDNLPESSFFNAPKNQDDASNNKKKVYLEIVDLLRKKKIKEGEKKITALLKETPNEANVYNLQALLNIAKNDRKNAIISSHKALALDPDNFAANIALSKLYLEEGDLSNARQYADKGISINKRAIFSYLILAEVAKREKNLQEVEQLLLTAKDLSLGNFKNDIVVTINLIKLYSAQKKPENTLPLAEGLVNNYPDNDYALAVLAEVQLANNKKALAEQSLRKLVGLEKKDIKHRLLLAKLLVMQSDKEKEVLGLLSDITEVAPDNPQVLIQKAKFLTILKKYPEAIDVAKEVNSLIPKLALGKMLEGDIYRAQKLYEKALPAYQQAYELKPNGKVLGAIVDILNSKGKPDEAIRFLEKELQKSDKNLVAHFKLASTYQQQQNISGAKKHYNAILKHQDANVIALNNLAWIYFQENNPKAKKLAEKAYNKQPKSALIADTYGSILVKQGDRKKGIEILKKAIALSPENYNFQHHLAQAYVDNGNSSLAIEILNKIVKFDQFSEKDEAVALLKKLNAKG